MFVYVDVDVGQNPLDASLPTCQSRPRLPWLTLPQCPLGTVPVSGEVKLIQSEVQISVSYVALCASTARLTDHGLLVFWTGSGLVCFIFSVV